MATVTKKQIVDRIAEKTQTNKAVVRVLIQSFLDEITTELAVGSRLEFRDFGVFETRQRGRRMAQNPRTLEKVEVPARQTVKFKAGRLLDRKVNDGAGVAEGDIVCGVV